MFFVKFKHFALELTTIEAELMTELLSKVVNAVLVKVIAIFIPNWIDEFVDLLIKLRQNPLSLVIRPVLSLFWLLKHWCLFLSPIDFGYLVHPALTYRL